jgi:hypothetical protein
MDERSARSTDIYPRTHTQRLQKTKNHATGGIRTRNPSKRAAADQHLRLSGHCNCRVWGIKLKLKIKYMLKYYIEYYI